LLRRPGSGPSKWLLPAGGASRRLPLQKLSISAAILNRAKRKNGKQMKTREKEQCCVLDDLKKYQPAPVPNDHLVVLSAIFSCVLR
jgi:hypothetical protein